MTLRFGLGLLTIGFCAACGGSSRVPTSPFAPTPPAPTTLAGTYEGNWTGTTSQSAGFGFVVAGNFLSRVEFNVSYADVSCTGGLGAAQTLGTTTAISNAEFSVAAGSPQGDMSYLLAGRFISTTQATGTLQVTIMRSGPPDSPSGCAAPKNIQVTWTARKVS